MKRLGKIAYRRSEIPNRSMKFLITAKFLMFDLSSPGKKAWDESTP
jgi:hypothetical protein